MLVRGLQPERPLSKRPLFAQRDARYLLGVVACSVAAAYIAGAGNAFGDAAIACLVVIMLRWNRNALIGALLALFLAYAAFPPLRYPTYMISLAPVFASWRSADRLRTVSVEGFAFGFALAWCSMPHLGLAFVDNQAFARLPASAFIGCQFLCLAAISNLTAGLRRTAAAVIVGISGAALEAARVYLVSFPLLLLAQPAAGSPVSQWASLITIFGVSAMLYFINFLAWPMMWNREQRAGTRLDRTWSGSLWALVVVSCAWIGGISLNQRVDDDPLPVDVVVVQPRVRDGRGVGEVNGQHFSLLQFWTNQAVERRTRLGLPKPELIVWPEFTTSLASDKLAEGTNSPAHWLLERKWADAILFGAIVEDPGGVRTNSAVLVQRDGRIQRYDKMKMIPFVETLPTWLERSWGKAVTRFFGVLAPFKPGNEYRLLTIDCLRRGLVKLGVSICCEAHFPQLAQYEPRPQSRLIIHLSNEDWFTESHPEVAWFTTWNVQYRAIETRSWQVVCSTSANSAIVDPRGVVRSLLGPEPGTLDFRFNSEDLSLK